MCCLTSVCSRTHSLHRSLAKRQLRAQAEAWSRGSVNANAIAPGFFATPLTAAVANDPVKWKANAERTFIGRNGELPDLTGTAIWLASRASDYVTGQTIFVDGGFSAG